jgi:hypothetical protein
MRSGRVTMYNGNLQDLVANLVNRYPMNSPTANEKRGKFTKVKCPTCKPSPATQARREGLSLVPEFSDQAAKGLTTRGAGSAGARKNRKDVSERGR